MSWFVLKDQPNRRKRKGIWLRTRSETIKDVNEAITKSNLMRKDEGVEWIEIKELRKDGMVLLEVWCHSIPDYQKNFNRHNVFHLLIKENPEWVCEGDLGRGL